MKDNIMVSISCIVYNHEKYIENTIKGFLMQKTNFKYEVLIHDDASTDGTPDIIRKYEKAYPQTIYPIYQKENQYSKGVKVGKFNRSRARGKYIALCEGDDYWIDPLKLQKQVGYMEKHPECSMCFHAAYKVNINKEKMRSHLKPWKEDREFNIEEIIKGGGGLFPTNSIMYLREKNLNIPEFYKNAPIDDYPLVIYMSLKGKVFYINEFMSAYRVGVPGSWTLEMTYDIEKSRKYFGGLEKMFDQLNDYTEYKYDKIIRNVKYKTKIKKSIPHVTKVLKILRNKLG